MSVRIYSIKGAEAALEETLISDCESLGSQAMAPFSEPVLECLKLLSKRLLSSDYSRAMPQLMALGYWIRPGAINLHRQNFMTAGDQAVIAPRGIAFHLPPQNVDTLFAYSWVLSYVAGNCNIVRVGRNPSEVSAWLIEQIVAVLHETGESHRNIFCTYDYESDCTKSISALSDLRVIWGGNEKIQKVSECVTRPDGLTLGFSDRKSMCLIKTDAYMQSTLEKKKALAQEFFNDIFWFDQLGCGSPRLVGWVGDATPDAEEFYALIDQVAQEKSYATATGVDLQKFSFANVQLANSSATTARRISANLLVIDAKPSAEVFDQVMGGGVLYQVKLSELDSVSELLRPDLQTVTEFGFDQSEKRKLAEMMGLKGGYRIVPIGKALEFNSVWDGIELLNHFTRKVTIM